MKASTSNPQVDKSKIATMTAGAGGGLGRLQKTAVAPKEGSGAGGKLPK